MLEPSSISARMKVQGVIVLLISVCSVASSFGSCPSEKLFAPCFCVPKEDNAGFENEIHCYKVSLDLKLYFYGLSKKLANHKKNFRLLILKDVHLEHLQPTTFHDMNFESIEFVNTKFKTIDEDAFKGTDQVTNYLRIENSKLTSHDLELFSEINKFKSLTDLVIINNTIKTLPEDAFSNSLAHLSIKPSCM